MAFLSIDPGLRHTGWALWEGDRLVSCGLSRARSMALTERVWEHRANIPLASEQRCCERMQARYGNAKGDVQDLIDLNLLAGALGNEWITVREWKGSMPRAVEQRRTFQTLSEQEWALLPVLKTPNSVGHDVWSAVGIGLYVLGRYK